MIILDESGGNIVFCLPNIDKRFLNFFDVMNSKKTVKFIKLNLSF